LLGKLIDNNLNTNNHLSKNLAAFLLPLQPNKNSFFSEKCVRIFA
jgi:hypothetical protein